VIALAPFGLLRPGEPLRLGNRDRRHAPCGVYPCAGDDAWLAIAVTDDAMWRVLCERIGRPDWREQTLAERRANHDRIDVAIAHWSRTRTSRQAFLELQQSGIAAAPSFTNEELASDPHLAARGVFETVEHPVLGAQKVMRAPWRMSQAPCAIRRHAPLLDQDRAVLLDDLL